MAERSPATRERILTAATELFVRKGYHGTGVQEISEAVGLGRGALYHHIGSKDQLLFEISMSLLDGARDATLPYAETDDPPDVKLRNLAKALLAHHAANGEGWLVAIQESRFLEEENRRKINAARDAFEAIWRGVLHDGAQAGLWRHVDGVDVRGVLGMFNYAARWMRADGPMSPEQIADRYVDLLLDGLRGER